MIVVSFGLITLEQIQHLPSDSSLISECPHRGINLARDISSFSVLRVHEAGRRVHFLGSDLGLAVLRR